MGQYTWRRKWSQGKKKVCSYFCFMVEESISCLYVDDDKLTKGENNNTGGSGLLEWSLWMGRRGQKWSKMEELTFGLTLENSSVLNMDRRENARIRIIENTEIRWLNLGMFSFDFIYFLHEKRSKVININSKNEQVVLEIWRGRRSYNKIEKVNEFDLIILITNQH